jgi:signal transduction histidine kinase
MIVFLVIAVGLIGTSMEAHRSHRQQRCASGRKFKQPQKRARDLSKSMDAKDADVVPAQEAATLKLDESTPIIGAPVLVPADDITEKQKGLKKESEAVPLNEPREISLEDEDSSEDESINGERESESEGGQHELGEQESEADELFQSKTSLPDADQQKVDRDVNLDAKRRDVLKLVAQGEAYFKGHPIDQVFSAFSHSNDFVKGELYLFVFDIKGTCLAHGRQNELIWKNLYDLKDTYGTYIVRSMIAKARTGGGWITYQWKFATKMSYVKEVRKGDKVYIIGAGYYPHSKEDAVVNLVKGAVALFNDAVKHGRSKDEVFSTMSYPLGRFTFGDLYLYALDFSGLQLAHGDLPGVIGTSGWTYRDASGKLVNQEIIAKLKEMDVNTGLWVEYVSKNAPKRTYAEKVADGEGKYYFIAGGYYPDADRNQATNLVGRVYRYMKLNGPSAAVHAITDRDSNEFRYGDLYSVVLNLKGICIAHGGNATLVGKNMFDDQDSTGFYFVREMIKKAQAGGGWTDYKEKNSFKTTYTELVTIGVDKFVIACGLYPVSKRETMILIAKSGADYLRIHSQEEAMQEFVTQDGKFTRGDLDLFVFDTSGICLAFSDDYDMIWRNFMQAADQTGKSYVKMMINAVQRGPGTVTYQLNNATRLVYVEPVEKNGRMFIVGSGFYF